MVMRGAYLGHAGRLHEPSRVIGDIFQRWRYDLLSIDRDIIAKSGWMDVLNAGPGRDAGTQGAGLTNVCAVDRPRRQMGGQYLQKNWVISEAALDINGSLWANVGAGQSVCGLQSERDV